MKQGTALAALALGVQLPYVSAADSSLPRGVGPDFAKFYQNSKTFTCISDPSTSLSPSQINDDYCDCPDGSDEPGTSACSYISPLSPQSHPHPNASTSASATGPILALPGFYCANKGHNPTYVPFTHINDGICDHELCCDGTEEWAHVGGVQCADKCKQIGQEWRKADNARRTSLNAAARKRKELVAGAVVKKREIDSAIKDLTIQIEASEVKVKDLEKEKAEVEKQETHKMVQGGGSGKVGILAGLAKNRLAEVRTALSRVRSQRDAYISRTEELEKILKTFKEEFNPNFNDEGVKRAVRSWDDYAAKEKEHEYDQWSSGEMDLGTTIDLGEMADHIDWDDFEREDEPTADDVAALYDLTSYIPPTLRTFLSTQLSNLRDLLITNGILAARPSSSQNIPESKALREAREQLQSAETDLQSQNTNRNTHEEELKKDYGRDDVFRTMQGRCVSLDAGEYTYELCWADKVSQKSKKGGSSQNMGHFAGFDTEITDEDMPADGRGLGAGERQVMRFEEGSHCWNGPARSTRVVMGCSEVEEVWKVSEEEKCVYRMEVGAPAVCDDEGVGAAQKERKPGVRDEL